MAFSTAHEILILGGNLAGSMLAHHLLNNTIPQLLSLLPEKEFHITVVEPSKEWYFKIGTPRLPTNSELVKESDAFRPNSAAFLSHQESIKFVRGSAISIEAAHRIMKVDLDGEIKKIKYDTLIMPRAQQVTPRYGQSTEISPRRKRLSQRQDISYRRRIAVS